MVTPAAGERLTGGQMVADYLVREGITHVFALPGHGNSALLDAFIERPGELTVIPAMHEQGAGHMAGGYWRASGKPAVVSVSIGPGSTNTITALSTAFVDSVPIFLITGGVHTYLENRGVLQEIDRPHTNNFPRVAEPVVKRWWQPKSVAEIPRVLSQAFAVMLDGRPGPVLVDLAQDLQAELGEHYPREPRRHRASGRIRGDKGRLMEAASLLADAQRPVILAGGGVVSSDASEGLLAVGEYLGAPVVHTFMGKGAIPADHSLYAGGCGDIGTLPGNALTRSAEVILAVGCRFSDRICSSYRPGVTFDIPPTKLIHVDIDGSEIGRNYPVEVGIVGDAHAVLTELAVILADHPRPSEAARSARLGELQSLTMEWNNRLGPMRTTDYMPATCSRVLAELSAAIPRDAFVVTDSGYAADQAFSELPIYVPRRNIMPGGMCEMGFGIPTAIGAQLAAPESRVLAIVGDGSLMQTGPEIAIAVMLDLPVVFVVLNNGGWVSVKDIQLAYGPDREIATEFRDSQGGRYFVDAVEFGRSLGCRGERVDDPAALTAALERNLAHAEPSLIEVRVADKLPWSGMQETGWWDVPVPAYLGEARDAYVSHRGF